MEKKSVCGNFWKLAHNFNILDYQDYLLDRVPLLFFIFLHFFHFFPSFFLLLPW